jgi:hypothetical protein
MERTMGQVLLNAEEIGTRGRDIYELRLRSQLEPDNIGKYLVIDIETGEYEIDDDGEASSLRARKKNPDGVRYGMRIGHRARGHIGLAGSAYP